MPVRKTDGQKMRNKAVGIGEVLWDMLPDGKKAGGAPANFTYHVSRFGIDGRIVSAVGPDSLGQEILDVFSSKGMRGIIPKVQFPTGTVQVTLDAAGIPVYRIMEGVAWDNIPYSAELDRLASETGAVCFGSLAQRSPVSRATVNRFLDAIPDDGQTLKIFDINLRQDFYSREIICNSLEKCNILKINDEELDTLGSMLQLHTDSIAGRCRDLMSLYGLRILILTCGAEGSYVFTADDCSYIKTPHVEVIDTVGAGDSFTGSFTAAIMKGLSPADAHRLAVDVSAFVCTQAGAMPSLPDCLVSKTGL